MIYVHSIETMGKTSASVDLFLDLQVQLLRPVEDAEALCRLGWGPPSAGFLLGLW